MTEEDSKSDGQSRLPFLRYKVDPNAELQVAKQLADLKLGLGERVDVQAIAKTLELPPTRLEGLSSSIAIEDEFLWRVRVTEGFAAAVKIDQTPYVQSDELQPPDVLVLTPIDRPTWRPRASLIEVKSTREETWKISERDLTRRRRFAETCGLPLFFAIKLLVPRFGAWVLLPAEALEAGRKVEVADVLSSWWDEFLGDCGVLMLDGVTIEERWDSETTGGIATQESLGQLVSFKVKRGSLELEGELARTPFAHGFFAHFRSTDTKEQSGTTTTVVKRLLPRQLKKFTNCLLDFTLAAHAGKRDASEVLRGMAVGEIEPRVRWGHLAAIGVVAEDQGFVATLYNRRGTSELLQMRRTRSSME